MKSVKSFITPAEIFKTSKIFNELPTVELEIYKFDRPISFKFYKNGDIQKPKAWSF